MRRKTTRDGPDTASTMTRQAFLDALDRHGARLDRWPAELAAAARTLVATDATAERELARAGRLEAALGAAVVPNEVDSALVGSIMAGLESPARAEAETEPTVRPTARLLAFVGAATLATLLVGFTAGLTMPADTGDDTLAGLMFGGAYSAYEDIGEDVL